MVLPNHFAPARLQLVEFIYLCGSPQVTVSRHKSLYTTKVPQFSSLITLELKHVMIVSGSISC